MHLFWFFCMYVIGVLLERHSFAGDVTHILWVKHCSSMSPITSPGIWYVCWHQSIPCEVNRKGRTCWFTLLQQTEWDVGIFSKTHMSDLYAAHIKACEHSIKQTHPTQDVSNSLCLCWSLSQSKDFDPRRMLSLSWPICPSGRLLWKVIAPRRPLQYAMWQEGSSSGDMNRYCGCVLRGHEFTTGTFVCFVSSFSRGSEGDKKSCQHSSWSNVEQNPLFYSFIPWWSNQKSNDLNET